MIERTYNVPLRSGFRNTTRYKKTKKAVTTLREFLQQHMKSDKILIGRNLNKFLWKDGIKNPPHHVKVTVIKEDDGTVKAELLGFKYEHMTKAEREAVKDKKEKAEKKKEEVKKEEKKKAEKAKMTSEDKKEETTKEDREESEETNDEETSTADATEKPKPKKKKSAKKE
jgi:ribosomal protein L31E